MTDWPPRVLSTVYSRNNLQTFYDLLVDLVTEALQLSDKGGHQVRAELRKEAKTRLVGEAPVEYVTLLKSSYAAMSDSAPALGPISFDQRWTQQQIVDRVIGLKFQQETKPSHVLCCGYRKLRPSLGDSTWRRAPQGLECACENSSVDIVTSHNWKILLSRVGDLIMLHVLSHVVLFTPLPNNCFLQILGPPTSCSVSMSRKSVSLHPGEKMLRGVARRNCMSEPYIAQPKQTSTDLCPSVLEDGGMHEAYHGESLVDDIPSMADQFIKQAYDEKGECAGDRVTGVVKNHGSNIVNFEKSVKLEKSCSDLENSQMRNSILSLSLRRHSIESAEIVVEVDQQKGLKKCCELARGELARKRQRLGTREHRCVKGKILKPGEGDAFHDHASVAVKSTQADNLTKSSETGTRNQCSKRKSLEEIWLQHSTLGNTVLSNDDNPHSSYYSKRLKLSKTGEKYTNFQKGNKLPKMADQVLSDLNVKIVQLSKCSNVSPKKSTCFTEHGSGATKHSHHDCRDSLVVQNARSLVQAADACSSRKRIRPPSWQRRKLRQAQESCQELGWKGFARQVNISRLDEPAIELDEGITKARSEESILFLSGLHQCQASERADFGCSLPSREITEERSFGSPASKQVPQRKKPLSVPGRTSGMQQRLVDRAPIFYNSNFSCHPGLPAKHVLNTTKPNDTGAANLFAAIFGAHCNISGCSSSGNHMYAKYSSSNLKPGLGSQLKSVHKLLKDLLSSAKRCGFACLLGRHCPLPEQFEDLPEDSPVGASAAPLPQSQGLELGMGTHEDVQQHCLSTDLVPEVEEIMSLWLGPNYWRTATATKCLEYTSTVPKEHERNQVISNDQASVMAHVKTEPKHAKRYETNETCEGGNLRSEKTVQAKLISCYTKHSKVVGFLWAVCRSIIPQEMLGCLRSWRALRSSIAHFVGLRRHEKFNVKHALFRLQVSSFSWLAFKCSSEKNTTPAMSSRRLTVEEREMQQKRLELWLYWLFTSLVVPLIRAHFYVTENENNRQNIFYYRKPVWARIQSNGLKELTSKNYKKLSRYAVSQALNSRVLGFSQIRLLPKRTGLRPIANLAASSQGTLKFSIQAKGHTTVCEAFEDISRDLLSGHGSKSDHKILSFPHEVSHLILEERKPDAIVKIYETSSSTDIMRKTIAATCSLVDGCPHSSLATVRGSSSSPSASKTFGSLILMKAPQVQKRSKKSVNFFFRSINSVLRDSHCCLKLEKEAHPEDLGSSVFGYSDIHTKILPFILQLKGSLNGMPPLFMAVCDVTKAYDTIQQEKLQEIVESFMQSLQYNVARYTCITPTLASVRISHGRTCSLADSALKFIDSVHELATKHSHCIFTDQALGTSVRREQILAMLGEHVKQNIVQIGAHFYHQTVGIPQGSILSSLLCSLFYGHFDVHGLLPLLQSHSTETSNRDLHLNSSPCESSEEAGSGSCLTSSVAKAKGLTECEIEQMLELCLDISDKVQDPCLASKPPVQKLENSRNLPSDHQDELMHSRMTQLYEAGVNNEEDSVLLRLIDDSFFISTSEGKAKIFVECMHRGSKEYGCQANKRKTAVSFYLQLGNEVLPKNVYKTEDGACFMRWSGLLINCYTLEFQADYTRYCGEHIRSTLTVRREQNQGWQLVLKMCQYMRPKCHALFYDPQINSPATIRLNAFQAFLLCAMKFHAYICSLPHVMGSNQPFFYKTIDCAIRYMYGLLRHKMDTVGAEAVSYFPYKELQWLALVAFHRVLKRKQARYQILLHMLQTQLQMPKYNILRTCPHILSATDERRSSMFKFIKY